MIAINLSRMENQVFNFHNIICFVGVILSCIKSSKPCNRKLNQLQISNLKANDGCYADNGRFSLLRPGFRGDM